MFFLKGNWILKNSMWVLQALRTHMHDFVLCTSPWVVCFRVPSSSVPVWTCLSPAGTLCPGAGRRAPSDLRPSWPSLPWLSLLSWRAWLSGARRSIRGTALGGSLGRFRARVWDILHNAALPKTSENQFSYYIYMSLISLIKIISKSSSRKLFGAGNADCMEWGALQIHFKNFKYRSK